MWKENAMQYFFRKILGLNFSATKLFLKNPIGLDIVGAFSWQQNFTFFFFIFSWCLIFDWGAIKAVGRTGQDSGMATGILGLTTYCCALWRKCIDGREKRFFRICKVNDGYILEELGKALAKWGNRIGENGGVRQAHPPKIFIWITAWKSGGKDSGIRAEKNCFLLALSDGAEYKPYKRLWLLLCFVPSDNIAEGKSDFFQL